MRSLSICAAIATIGAATLLVGCAGRPTGYLSVEENITARGGLGENGVFHDVLYNPESIALQFPGYIIGLDKGRRRAVLADAVLPQPEAGDSEGVRKVKNRLHGDFKVHYVSHIVHNSGKPFGQDNCVLYTMYSPWGMTADAAADDPSDAPGALCKPRAQTGKAASAFNDSKLAISALDAELAEVLAPGRSNYTHVLVVVMGWNTEQIEAVRNFNAIVAHMKTASAGQDFRPLFIGVTWASSWSANWLEPAVKGLSYIAKAHDADEVGTTWLAEILDTLRRHVPATMPTVAIGHSFGARTLASALCAGSVLKPADGRQERRPWDLFIAWQGAFSLHRMEKGGSGDGFVYKDNCSQEVRSIAMTASRHDKAVDDAFWADMAGSIKSWRKTCPENGGAANNKFNCIAASGVQNKRFESFDLRTSSVTYIDASNIVFFNQPNTGGGAHSDIYRAVHGRMNWHLIQRSAAGF